jgi:hypothetical protein
MPTAWLQPLAVLAAYAIGGYYVALGAHAPALLPLA